MIRELTINHFKSWQKITFSLAPITCIFGSNSSGKSSIIQFLLMLKQTKDATDRSLTLDLGSPTSPAHLGSYRDVVFRHDVEQSMAWELKWDLPSKLTIQDPVDPRNELFAGDQMVISSEVELRREQLSSKGIQYEFSGGFFRLKQKEGQPSKYMLEPTERNPLDDSFRFRRNQGRV